MENQPDTSTHKPTNIRNDRDEPNTSSKWIRLLNQTGETIIRKENSKLNFALKIASRLASLFAVFIGLIVLAGWAFDIASFKSVFPNLATMKANTAFAFLLSGTSLWLLQTTSKTQQIIARILAVVVAIIGLLTLSAYLFGLNFNIDQIIFKDSGTVGVPFPGRMSPATAFNFAIIGFSLCFLMKENSRVNRKAQWVAAIAVLISLLALIGYAYGIQSLYRIPPFTSMALHTAFAFYILFIGIVFTQPTQGIMAIIFKRSIGGILARRLIPAALVIPFVIGWFRLKAEHAGYFTTEFGVALSTTFNVTIFVTLVLLVARSLDKTDMERKRMVEELRESEARYRTVIETASDAIITIDQNSKIQFVNSSVEKIFGYTIEELLGQQLTMLMPAHLQDIHLGGLRRYVNTGHRHISWSNVELPGVHKSGQEILLEVSFGEFNKKGQRFFTGTLRDITERKHAEEALRKSQEQFAGIISSAMDAIITIDEEQKIILFNAAAEKMFLCSSNEAMGEPVTRFIPERFRSTHKSHIENFGQTKVTKRSMGSLGAIFGLRTDGEEFPIEASISQFESESKKFYTVILRDITERERAEKRFHQVIEGTPNGMVMVDKEGKIVLVNAQIEKTFDYNRNELLGQSIEILVPRRFHTHHPDYRNNFMSNPTTRPMGAGRDLFGLRKDGTEFPVEIGLNPIETEQGMMVLGTIVDITERKSAEAKLREQTQILDLAPVVILDLNQRIVFWNTGAEMMYGWKQEETVGKLSHNLLQTEFPKSLEEIKSLFLANGFWEGELIHTKKDGERIVVASQWVLHKNDNGEPKAILEINKDITERRQAQEQIQKLNEELEHRVVERTKQLETANKELEAFSYSVSHDLRAPLRAINGFSQALSEDYEDIIDDEGKGYLQEIRNASKDMAQLIDDMLQLARVSRSEIRNEQINLSDMVNAIVNQLQKDNPDHKVTIRIEAGLIAKGDQRLFKIMLSNLLENAWKFTSKRENAEIIFGHEVRDNETVYLIRDNGVGFDMEYADKLFGVFQRLHSVGEFEGTGVGLATVQRILNRHGGRVWAEGKVNHGATFYFTLPIIE